MASRRKFIGQGLLSVGALMSNRIFADPKTDLNWKEAKFTIRLTAEELLYQYTPANNGAGPMWANGMTSVIRQGNQVFASGLETVPEVKGLSKCRWMLFKRHDSGWKLEAKDLINLNREPCPLAVYDDKNILLSVNPKQADSCIEYCPTHPEILKFSMQNPQLPYERLVPVWEKNPGLMDHSYRAMGVDRMNKELILFQNYEYRHAEWSFMDRKGKWSANGSIKWPTDSYGGKEVPLRLCYSNVALRDKKVFFFSTGDIVEPNEKWRVYKKNLTGATWDYVFRRLYFSWTDDITKGKFHPWIEIANYDRTAGYIRNQDVWIDSQGLVHLLWIESAIDERLRNDFFTNEKQKRTLCYAIFKDGKIVLQTSLLTFNEGDKEAVYAWGNARFQAAPDGRLFVVYYATGTNAGGERVSENRVVELLKNGQPGPHQVIPFKNPFISFQTANERAGCAASNWLDILGVQEGKENTISYGQVFIG